MDRCGHKGKKNPFLSDAIVEGNESLSVDYQPLCGAAKKALDILKPPAPGNKNSGTGLNTCSGSSQEHTTYALIARNQWVAQAREGWHVAIPQKAFGASAYAGILNFHQAVAGVAVRQRNLSQGEISW
jgi:hypothetical protein